MGILKRLKQNYEYARLGFAEERKEYKRLQRIKNTPENFRTEEDQAWADVLNKTKRKKKY